MSAPTLPITPAGFPAEPEQPVTLALTVVADPDNPVVNDLHLSSGQLHWFDGDDAVLQVLRSRLLMGLGEWFLNQDEGVPYFQHILVKNPDSALIKSIIKKIILSVPGIAAVTSISLVINKTTREASVGFTGLFDSGADFSSANFAPFVLGGIPS